MDKGQVQRLHQLRAEVSNGETYLKGKRADLREAVKSCDHHYPNKRSAMTPRRRAMLPLPSACCVCARATSTKSSTSATSSTHWRSNDLQKLYDGCYTSTGQKLANYLRHLNGFQTEWQLVWRWIQGRLGKPCGSYIDNASFATGHLVHHKQGPITWSVGVREL